MLSIVISLVVGVVFGFVSTTFLESTAWHVFFGVLGFLAGMVAVNQIFGRRLKGLINQVQLLLQESQGEAMKLVNRFQSKPLGSQKVMQDQIEKVMERGVRQALSLLDQAQPMYKWNLLAERQIATLRFQLLYQIKEMDEADKLMKKIMTFEPTTMAMKMARLYAQEKTEELDKAYKKGVKRFKYDKAILIYSLYAWILLKQKRYDEALEVLDQAKDKTEDETIARNWQLVANKKYNNFSNSGLGEQWYALHLENMPKQKASKGQMKGNPLAPKGKRKYF